MVVCERWVGDWTYWPQVPLTIAALLSHSVGLLNRGSWGPKPSAGSLFSLPRTETRTLTNWLELTKTIGGTGLYNCLTSTCFLWVSHLHRIQPVHGQGYILISSTGCTSFWINVIIQFYITAVRPLASHLKTTEERFKKKTCEALLEKQGRTHKWCSSMDLYT